MYQGVISRKFAAIMQESLSQAPVTAILGPRQCGKTTLVKTLAGNNENFILLDLESPSDKANLLHDVEKFFQMHSDKTVCLDEVQNAPEIFSVLRYVVDQDRRNGRFIVLGSATPDLLRQSQSLPLKARPVARRFQSHYKPLHRHFVRYVYAAGAAPS
jgi:predicted AAA+ superfamily ATPase